MNAHSAEKDAPFANTMPRWAVWLCGFCVGAAVALGWFMLLVSTGFGR